MGASSSFITNPNADPIDVQRMLGAWYVVESNLDVWKSRLCPVIIYESMELSAKEKKNAEAKGQPPPVRVRDITEFRTGDSLEKQSSSCSYYLGVDTQNSSNGTIFRWNGSGLLSMLSSDWQIQKHDPDYSWAIVVFGPTTFTKAGLDIYSREPTMTDEKLEHIRAIIANDPYLKERYVNMFKAVQDPRGRNRPGSKHHIQQQQQEQPQSHQQEEAKE